MKTSVCILFCLSGFAMSSCGGGNAVSEEPTLPPTPKPENKKIEIKINASLDGTRATDSGFETNDRIGLFVVNYNGNTPGNFQTTGNYADNMLFTYTGTWNPETPIYWKDNTTHADFYLYYPYSRTINSVSAMPFEIMKDQSSEASYKASELLIAKASNVAPTEEAVKLTANHVMSLTQITLKAGNGFTSESLAAASVSVKINGIKTKATVNLANSQVSATGETTSIVPLKDNGAYKALIIPQTTADGNLITVIVDGKEFNLKKAFTFESGKRHKFTVTLNKTSNGINVNINPWDDDETDNGGIAE